MKNWNRKPVICCGFTPCIQRMVEFSFITMGKVNRALRVTEGTGGKGTNTARIVKTLGGIPLLLGFSGGQRGRQLEALLCKEGIEFRFISVKGETRICQTLLETGNSHVTELVEEAPPLTSNDWKKMRELFQSLELSGAIVSISGKLPPGAPDSAYAELVEIAGAAGAEVLVDTPGVPLIQCLEFSPALVKINELELRELSSVWKLFSNDWKSPVAGCRRLLEKGAEAVLITCGSKPAVYLDRNESFKMVPPEIEVVNAVGSGDAVMAGVAYELSCGKTMREALITGMACGAANALNPISGAVRHEDVTRFQRDIGIIPFR